MTNKVGIGEKLRKNISQLNKGVLNLKNCRSNKGLFIRSDFIGSNIQLASLNVAEILLIDQVSILPISYYLEIRKRNLR